MHTINESGAQALNEQRITSLEIAEISGKNHRDILRSVKSQEVAWEEVNGRKFALVKYKDSKGEQRPMYEFSKMESLYITSKFNDFVRAKLVRRWMELELQSARERSQQQLESNAEELFWQFMRSSLDADDVRSVAGRLNLSTSHVRRVRTGHRKPQRVINELVAQALHNINIAIPLEAAYDNSRVEQLERERDLIGDIIKIDGKELRLSLAEKVGLWD